MYQKKTPKCQLPDKNEFTVYNPNDGDVNTGAWPEVVKIISIDPGIRNLALRVESRGITSGSFPIKTLVFDKLHIKEVDRKIEGNTDNLFKFITNFLDSYLHIFKDCQMMLIERQLPINYKAVRISQHIISYFLLHFRNLPTYPMIYEVDPKLKGRQLGASNKLNERGIKQWAIDECRSLLTKRHDWEGIEVLNKNKKKADDHSDTVVQIEAFFAFNNWPLTRERLTLNISKKGYPDESIKPEKVVAPKLVLKIVKM